MRTFAKWSSLVLVAPVVSGLSCLNEHVEFSSAGTVTVPPSCTSLHVDGDTAGLGLVVKALESHPALVSLSLARDPRRARFEGGVSSEDIELLCEVLPSTGITQLSLAFNRVGDEGLTTVANALAATKLTALDVEGASVNAAGAAALAAVVKAEKVSLVTINFSHNNVGGAVDALIEAAKASSTLASIGDEGTVLGRREHFGGQALRSVLKGECFASPWSEWTQCPGACGDKGEAMRTRKVLHAPHQRHMSGPCAVALKESKGCSVQCNAQLLRPAVAPKASAEASAEAVAQEVAQAAALEAAQATDTARQEVVAEEAQAAEERASKEAAENVTAEEEEKEEEEVVAQSYHSRLEAFYSKYNPSKLPTVDDMLARYKGRESVLFNSLISKYGPEPV